VQITDVTIEAYRWPRPTPIANGKHTYSHVGLTLVKIATSEGVTGIGFGGGAGVVEQATIAKLKPLLLGEDPLASERIWHKLWVPKLVGRRGLTTRGISAIDIGLWDIRAKVAGLPLYKLLGAFTERVPTYVAGGYYAPGKGLKELAAEMASYVEVGARAVKMKVGAASLADDVARVRAVRAAIGPEVKLMVDANCAYKPYQAIQFARRIEEFEPFWFEEPIAPDDYDGHRRIAQAIAIPLASGENEYTRYGFRDLIATGAVPILNADATHCGGITEFMKIAALAQAHDLEIAPHGEQEVHVHLVAALANGLMLEFYPAAFNPLWETMYRSTIRLNSDGTVSPPETPGIGIDPNDDLLAQYRVA
jgi:D-arabinonate dehydratase